MSHFYYTNVERKENKSVKLGCIIVGYCASVLVLCGFVLLKNRRAFGRKKVVHIIRIFQKMLRGLFELESVAIKFNAYFKLVWLKSLEVAIGIKNQDKL